MGIAFGSLIDDLDWTPMELVKQARNPSYFWTDGRPLVDAPVDFVATFDGAMWVSLETIDVAAFNRNPLRVRPNFTVPRHHHNMDEMIFVSKGEYSIEHGDEANPETTRVGPGDFFLSRAGTPYTMTAGPAGVTYIETWPKPVTTLETTWHDVGWVYR